MKPVRVFQLFTAVIGVGIVVWLLLLNRHPQSPVPQPVPQPVPPPLVKVKPAVLDFPIAEPAFARLKESFGKPAAITGFCCGKEPLEPKLKVLGEISEVLLRHVAAETLPAGDSEPTYAQLVVELSRYREELWRLISAAVPKSVATVQEIPVDDVLKLVNRTASPGPKNSAPRLADGPLIIVHPDGRRQAANWNNGRLYEMEMETPGPENKQSVPPFIIARERSQRLYDEITKTLRAWQDAKWIPIQRPLALADLCEIFFRQQPAPKNTEECLVMAGISQRFLTVFLPFLRDDQTSRQTLPELSWLVNPRLPELFLPIIQGDLEAIKALEIDAYHWDSRQADMASLPRGETGSRVEKACVWVRDYIMACAYSPQPPESAAVVDRLVKEMVDQLQVPPRNWSDWIAHRSLAATLDYWRNMVWVGMPKPPALAQTKAQTQTVPRTWFEALAEMMAANPAWATSLLVAKEKRTSSAISWTWDSNSDMADRMALNNELLDRLEAIWRRQDPFILPQRLAPPLHPLLKTGPLILPFEARPFPNKESKTMEWQGDMLVPAKMWFDEHGVEILKQRLLNEPAVKGTVARMPPGYLASHAPDEAGARERLVTMLATRYQNLSADKPIEALQKENLRLKLIDLSSSLQRCQRRLPPELASLTLPGESFQDRPEFKQALAVSPDEMLKGLAKNQDPSVVTRQYDQLLGLEKDYFKTRCFAGPIDKDVQAGLAAILPPRIIPQTEKIVNFQTAMLEMLDRSVMQRARARTLAPGDTQESFDELTLLLLNAVAESMNYTRLWKFFGNNSDYGKQPTANLGRQIHQMLGRWRDAKDWQALKQPRWLRRLPPLDAFSPTAQNDTIELHGFLYGLNPCFFEDLLFRLAENADPDKAALKLADIGRNRILICCSHAMPRMIPDEEFLAMTGKLMTRKHDPQDKKWEWKWNLRMMIVSRFHLIILDKIAQEKLPEGSTPENIVRLVDQMIACYQEEKTSARSGLAMSLYTLQQAPWQAMPMPEKLKALNLVPDLPPEAKKLMAP